MVTALPSGVFEPNSGKRSDGEIRGSEPDSPAFSPREDWEAKLEKLLVEAEDCNLIAKLAADPSKRELFAKLGTDLRAMARDVEAEIVGRRTSSL